MKRRKKALFFGLVVLAFLLAAAFAPALTPFDPYEQNLEQALRAPDRVHLLGTDRYGRDLLSRVILGGRTSIFSALILVGITTFCGGAIGIFCGFYQGRLDGFFMRLSDIFLAFPGMVFAIAAASVMHGGIWNAILALALISWPKYARLTRSQVLGMKHTSYMAAAKLSGCSPVAVILRHVLPNIYLRTGGDDGCSGYWNDDDGNCGAFLPGTGRDAAGSRVGIYDEQWAKHAADGSLGGSGPRFCYFLFRCCLSSVW